ncbi:hypothetical protein [Pedobacter deserti]|uniref:hypothetical protein n=1 Tax=Pedobacter deserti TaxID=2817382 RepID=UPI00210D8BAD|nr:hypothetical protein [Pedobacter sp. SYSU D00382]
MKKGLLTCLFLFCLLHIAWGQTIKTGVLVLGGGNSAVAASLQSAISGVKTHLLLPGNDLGLSMEKASSGTGLEATLTALLDSLGEPGIRKWVDSTKNLSVVRSVSWQKLKRSGQGWVMELGDGRKVRAEVLVRPDTVKAPAIWQPFDYQNNNYRTSIGANYGADAPEASILSLHALLGASNENEIILPATQHSLAFGQAAGATAAYAAFFKKKTSEASLKDIQGELIKYNLALIPFEDVKPADTNWRAIQFAGLTGVLKASLNKGKAYFKPEEPVSVSEVKDVIKEYYYKAQIWFDDHKSDKLTAGDALSLICYVGGKAPESTEKQVRKNWNTSYGFKTPYNPSKVVSRRELAALMMDYLNPFNVTIDKTGRVLR